MSLPKTKVVREYLKNFLYSRGKPSAGKWWATVFTILFCITYILRLFGVSHIDNSLVGLMLGSLSVVVGFYIVFVVAGAVCCC